MSETIMNNGYDLMFKKGHLFGSFKPEIEKVIFSGPCTIVQWSDGDKTIVRCDGEDFDKEKGLSMAITKKFFGTNKSKSNYNDIFKKWCHDEINDSKDFLTKHSNAKKYVTVKEFCILNNCTKNKAYRMIKTGELSAKKDSKGKWIINV